MTRVQHEKLAFMEIFPVGSFLAPHDATGVTLARSPMTRWTPEPSNFKLLREASELVAKLGYF